MEIITNKEFCIATTDVRSINNKEMRQMHELKLRIKEVLDNHEASDEQIKKAEMSRIYIGDDDLKMMFAILSVFTKNFASTQCSAFDNFLQEIEKSTKEK